MAFRLKTISYPASATPVPLHDGTNNAGQPPELVGGFILQTENAQVDLGENDVAANTGLTIKKNESTTISAHSSRGSYQSYKLSEIYYIGGAFTLTVEKETR